jgi:hypothetical protein
MGYPDHDNDLGIEGTRIFPALSPHPAGPGEGSGASRADDPPYRPMPGGERRAGYARAGESGQPGGNAWHSPGERYPAGGWAGRYPPGARYPAGERPGGPEPGRYARPASYAGEFPVIEAPVIRPRPARQGRARPGPMRADRWVIAGSSVVAIIALIVGIATARVPGKAMPSPFAPSTTRLVPVGPPPAHASKAPVGCAASGP